MAASYTALTGVNNSGKSTYLKGLWAHYGDTKTNFVPVSRFVDSINLTRSMMPPSPVAMMGGRSRQLFESPHNTDGASFNLSEMVRQLRDRDRDRLFAIAEQWIKVKFYIELSDPENSQSDAHLKSDGAPFQATSTGTRLLFTLLTFCADSRYSRILIDEPELGLSPDLQSILSDMLSRDDKRLELFPHLTNVVVATHSHLFLDRNNIENNFVAEKKIENNKTSLSLRRIDDMRTFHDVQLRLMGNSLGSFFLPEAIVAVEGKTDLPYLKLIIAKRFPARNIAVVDTNGSPKDAVYRLSHAFGGLGMTPYSRRLLVVFDSVHNKDQTHEIAKLGVPSEHIIRWEKNGIEYLYPKAEMEKIFKGPLPSEDFVKDDVISARGIEYKKADLSTKICAMISDATVFPEEIESKLMKPLREVLDGK